eukprot:scaffold98969_cov75-Phaeocystis_antarctica.AAC.3
MSVHRVAGKKASRRAIRALKPQLRRLCLVTGPGALVADEAEVTFDDSSGRLIRKLRRASASPLRDPMRPTDGDRDSTQCINCVPA